MPWYNGNFPPSYKNQPEMIKKKAVEIANTLLTEGVDEGIAIATGLKRARLHFKRLERRNKNREADTFVISRNKNPGF